MKRVILFFGALRDAAGTAAIEAELPGSVADVPGLIDWLGGEQPHLAAALRARGVRVALDKSFASADAPLGGAGEIAFMSPLSGG